MNYLEKLINYDKKLVSESEKLKCMYEKMVKDGCCKDGEAKECVREKCEGSECEEPSGAENGVGSAKDLFDLGTKNREALGQEGSGHIEEGCNEGDESPLKMRKDLNDFENLPPSDINNSNGEEKTDANP